MHTIARSRLTGFWYVLPALLCVGIFTAWPFIQMVWISLNDWSLITPPTFIGFDNYLGAFGDSQFWVSLRFTLLYTLYLTPILMIGGYLIALLVTPNSGLSRATRTFVFTPVVIGLGASSLLWYWLFSYDYGLVNRALVDLGVTGKPILWFGADADTSLWAVIISVTWKVLGFGMLLFVAAIHAIPGDVFDAAKVDGAGYWARARHITLPLTARTLLLVTLISAIGSLLAFDQFYIMTAGQPRNMTATSVFLIYLNSFPYLKLGYGAALSLILSLLILVLTVIQIAISRRAAQ